MEGAHKQQRLVSDAIIVGDKVEAAKRRRRAQHGAAAAGRRGESIKVARALNGAINLKVLEKDADEAIKAGTGLVQASLEHLHTPALGVPGVPPVSAEKRFQILKLKFTASP